MPKLTKSFVDSIKPGAKETLYWDADLKRFGLRVTPKGSKSYIVQYRNHEGRSRKFTIGRHGSPWTPEEARKRAREILIAASRKEDPAKEKIQDLEALTITELADLYLKEGPAWKPDKKQSTWDTDAAVIKRHIRILLGNCKACSLTQADVAKFQVDVANGKSAARYKTKPRGLARVRGGRGIAARTVAVLGAMLEFGVRNGYLVSNVARGVPLYKTRKLERFLSVQELARLGETLRQAEEEGINATAISALRLLLLTGARKGEILGLEWKWVNFDTGYLNLPDSKTGAKRIPLGAPALELLANRLREAAQAAKDMKEEISPFVFPATDNDQIHFVGLQKVWEVLRSKAGLDDVRVHDLRHSFASIGVASGHSLYMIGKILGHKQTRTTEIYAHLQDDPLRLVTNQTAQQIAVALGLGNGSGNNPDPAFTGVGMAHGGNVVPFRRA